MKKPAFVDNHIYHIYNRGVEKRDVFMNDKDRFRFIHDLFEFNDEAFALHHYYKSFSESPEVGLRKFPKSDFGRIEKKPRKCLVDILAFCLMPNHFHLLVQQKKEGGIVAFMQKLGTGYTNYFNKKYDRVGPLFQGKFKAVLVEEESHFMYLPLYIHANPIVLAPPAQGKNISATDALQFLESYRWSSYPDYLGKKNFPSITRREFLLSVFGTPAHHQKEMAAWIKEMKSDAISEVALD